MALLDQGTLLPATDYVNAQRARRAMRSAWRAIFDSSRLTPAPSRAMSGTAHGPVDCFPGRGGGRHAACCDQVSSRRECDGVPALSIPCGLSVDGLPLGLQLIGPAWSEKRLFAYGAATRNRRLDRVEWSPKTNRADRIPRPAQEVSFSFIVLFRK